MSEKTNLTDRIEHEIKNASCFLFLFFVYLALHE